MLKAKNTKQRQIKKVFYFQDGLYLDSSDLQFVLSSYRKALELSFNFKLDINLLQQKTNNLKSGANKKTTLEELKDGDSLDAQEYVYC